MRRVEGSSKKPKLSLWRDSGGIHTSKHFRTSNSKRVTRSFSKQSITPTDHFTTATATSSSSFTTTQSSAIVSSTTLIQGHEETEAPVNGNVKVKMTVGVGGQIPVPVKINESVIPSDARIPSCSMMPAYPLFNLLEQLSPEMLKTVPNFRPIGTVKRLQTVIEMAYMDEEDDFELSMEDLDEGVSWYRYSTTVKTKAMESAERKNPNDTFKVDREVECVELEEIKTVDIKVEDDDDEDLLIVYEHLKNASKNMYNNATQTSKSLERDDREIAKDEENEENIPPHEIDEINSTLEIPADEAESDLKKGLLGITPIKMASPTTFNLVRIKKRLISSSLNSFKPKNKWGMQNLVNITPKGTTPILPLLPIKSSKTLSLNTWVRSTEQHGNRHNFFNQTKLNPRCFTDHKSSSCRNEAS